MMHIFSYTFYHIGRFGILSDLFYYGKTSRKTWLCKETKSIDYNHKENRSSLIYTVCLALTKSNDKTSNPI